MLDRLVNTFFAQCTFDLRVKVKPHPCTAETRVPEQARHVSSAIGLAAIETRRGPIMSASVQANLVRTMCVPSALTNLYRLYLTEDCVGTVVAYPRWSLIPGRHLSPVVAYPLLAVPNYLALRTKDHSGEIPQK